MIKFILFIILFTLSSCSNNNKNESICLPSFIDELFDLKVCLNQPERQIKNAVGAWGEDYDTIKTNRHSSKLYKECYLGYVFDFKNNKLNEIEVTSGTLWPPTDILFHKNRLTLIINTLNEFVKEKGIGNKFDGSEGSKSLVDRNIMYTLDINRFEIKNDKKENIVYTFKVKLIDDSKR